MQAKNQGCTKERRRRIEQENTCFEYDDDDDVDDGGGGTVSLLEDGDAEQPPARDVRISASPTACLVDGVEGCQVRDEDAFQTKEQM